MANQKQLPFPGVLSTPICPPCFSTNSRQRSKPRPVPCSCSVPGVETLSSILNNREHISGEMHTCIHNLYPHICRPLNSPDFHPATCRGIFDGITEQIANHRHQGASVGKYAEVIGNEHLNREILAYGCRNEGCNSIFSQVPEPVAVLAQG